MVNPEYSDIISNLSRVACTPSQLNELKRRYRNDINSVRMFERIQTLYELIRTLETRDIVHEESTNNLRDIAEFLERLDIFEPEIQVFPDFQSDIYDRITYMIGQEIGYKWKDFARSLGIREGQIDALEMNHRSISDRIHDIMFYYRQNFPPHTFRTNIQYALEEARRRDLSIQVASMIDNYNGRFRGDSLA